MSEPVVLFERAVGVFDEQVSAIGEGQWARPTPCAEWDVRALVHHLVYEDVWAVPLLHGATIEEVGDRFEGELLRGDAKGAWRGARDGALAAVRADGVLDMQVHVSWGQIPGREYVMQLFSDHLVHAWDLATAIGAETTLPTDLVTACLAWAEPQNELFRSSGVFGDPVDVEARADVQTRLLAFYGRRA